MGGRTVPLITLHADRFVCRGLNRMVPWIGVERVKMTRQRSTHVFIHLKETTKLPRCVSGWGVLVSAGRRVITMLGVRPRGLSTDGFVDLIQRYGPLPAPEPSWPERQSLATAWSSRRRSCRRCNRRTTSTTPCRHPRTRRIIDNQAIMDDVHASARLAGIEERIFPRWRSHRADAVAPRGLLGRLGGVDLPRRWARYMFANHFLGSTGAGVA